MGTLILLGIVAALAATHRKKHMVVKADLDLILDIS